MEGVQIEATPNKKWQFDYEMGDVKAAYRRGDWRNWQDVISWLEKFGEADNELTPGETVALVEDLRSLRDSGAQFTRDPMQAFQMAHKFRSQNKTRYAQEHARFMPQARRR